MRKILSLDGGGIRGIIPALVLAEIEKQTLKPISESFDLIAGTSTGGILALGLSKLKNGKIQYSAQDLAELYFENANQIFDRSLWKNLNSISGISDEKYSHKGIESVLKIYFDEEPLSQANTPTLVSAYDIEKRKPVFFKSWKTESNSTPIRLIARATSAAPTYFEPAYFNVNGEKRALIDGGVFINNPAMSAYIEATKIFPDEKDFIVVSIGTGELTREIPYHKAKNWGKLGWMLPVLSCMFDGVSDVVNYQMGQLIGKQYFRLQTELSSASDDMDDVSEDNLQELKNEAGNLIKNQAQTIKEICNLIAQNESAV